MYRIEFTDQAMSGIELLALRYQLLTMIETNPAIRFQEAVSERNTYQLVFEDDDAALLFLLSQDLEQNFVVHTKKIL
jgi:hypothetical protein